MGVDSLKIESRKVNNNGINIHYYDSNVQSSLVPLLICPGLSETAEEYLDLMEYLLPRRCIVLSFRGRGQSDTPDTGYKLEEHVSDIDCVVKSANLSRFHIYSYSRGVSYALGFLQENISKVTSIIVQDYPAQHKEMSVGWAEKYINDYLVTFSRQSHIRPEAVRGIQRESEQVNFNFRIDKRILVIRGCLEGSLLDDEGINKYQSLSPNVMIKNFQNSGHDIRNTEKDLLY